MSKITKQCVLVGPGHNLPAEFDPRQAETLGEVNIRLLQRGVLQLGDCDCDEYRRMLPTTPWSYTSRCPHLLVTHSRELLEAIESGKVNSVVVKQFDYSAGIVVWVRAFSQCFWLRKLPETQVIHDDNWLGINWPPIRPELFPEKNLQYGTRRRRLVWALKQRSEFWFKGLNRSLINLLDYYSTYEIEANTPCCLMDVETEPEVIAANCAYFHPGHNVFGMQALKDGPLKRIPVTVKFLEGQAVEVTCNGVTETWYTHDPIGLVLLRNRKMFLAEGTTRIYVEMDHGNKPFHMSREPIQKCKPKRQMIGAN